MNILIVDDEKIILEGISEYLGTQGYHIFKAEDGEKALSVFRDNSVDLVILDIMLPGKTGFEVLGEIRKTSNVPIILLSALNDEQTQLSGFALTADDYVIKPFSLPLLASRIKVLFNRHYGEHEIWTYKDAIIDFSSYTATFEGDPVDVKPKEIDILKLLLRNQNRVLSRGQIIEQLWNSLEEPPLDRVIDVYVKNLRKKLGLDCIVTVKNVGYKLI